MIAHWSTWPRLYLDAADLIRIGDGKVESTVVADLVNAASTQHVFLVVSIEHFQDAVPRADAASRTRLADAIDLFKFRAVVMKGPIDIEPWESEPCDIEIEPASNIRELIHAPQAGPYLGSLCFGQDVVHSAVAEVVPLGATQLSREANDVTCGCLVSLTRGSHAGDLNSLVAKWERIRKVTLGSATRAQVIERVAPWQRMLESADQRFGLDARMRQEILTAMLNSWDQDVLERAPGLSLATKLSNAQMKDSNRSPKRSDSVDGMHVRHFPYVDIATCDAFVHHAITNALPLARGSRTVKLIRNGRLEEVTAAIRAL